MRRAPIRLLARLGTGHTPSRSHPEYWAEEERTIPWLTLADVWQLRDGTTTVIRETAERITPKGVANSSAVVHPAGTVALSRTASVGFSCILGHDMATSQDFVTWTCGPHIDPRFLLWVLRGERDDIVGRMRGSTHKTIYMSDIEQLTTPVPDIEEQRRIAAFLDVETERIDQLIATKTRMISTVEKRTEADLEGHLRRASDCYPRTPLRRLVTSITQGTSSQAGNRPAAEDEWGILKLSAVKGGQFCPWENKACSQEAPVDETLRPTVGDLLVTRSNTPAYVGDVCAVVMPPGRVLLPDLIYRLVVDDGADSRYLAAALRTSQTRHYLSSAARGTSQSMVKLRGEDVLNCRLPVPPLAEQRAIADTLDESRRQADRLVDALRQQIELLRERRCSLITAAVTGEMEVA